MPNKISNLVSRTRSVALMSALVMVFLITWPLVSGYSFVHDEHTFCLISINGNTFGQNLHLLWHSVLYRVLDLVSGYLCNPHSLNAKWTMLLQTPALAAIAAGIVVLARTAVPNSPNLPALALLWFGLHSSTSVALWIPTVGQSWSAAMGIWLCIVAFKAYQSLMCGQRIPILFWAVLCGIGVLAPHIKETYYGWAGAVAAAILVLFLWGPENERKASRARELAFLQLMILGPPLLHGLARIASGGLLGLTRSDQGRYHAQFGFNLAKNAAISIGGQLAATPVHYVRRDGPIQLIAIAGICLSAGLAASALSNILSSNSEKRYQARALALIAASCQLSTCVTWPMQRISELYFMGPNAGMAVLVAAGATKLWISPSRFRRLAGRATVIAAFAVATLGLISRSLHFRITWRQGATLYAEAYNYQSTLPKSDGVHTICFPAVMLRGWQHSQYVMPPANALNPNTSAMMLNALNPNRKVEIVPEPVARHCDYRIEGKGLPKQLTW